MHYNMHLYETIHLDRGPINDVICVVSLRWSGTHTIYYYGPRTNLRRSSACFRRWFGCHVLAAPRYSHSDCPTVNCLVYFHHHFTCRRHSAAGALSSSFCSSDYIYRRTASLGVQHLFQHACIGPPIYRIDNENWQRLLDLNTAIYRPNL